jgi:creatinine amidohydrolase
MAVHQLASLTWPAFRAVPRGSAVAVLPTGAVEAHGPHLPLGTDIVIAEAMARAGAARLATRGLEVVVLPVLPMAAAPFAAAFEGTLDVPAAATTLTIVGIARSLARHGVATLAIANAHHDPAHVTAIRDAVRELGEERSITAVFPDLTRRRWAGRLTEEFQSGACHAGRYETSVLLAVAPGAVNRQVQSSLAPNERSLVVAIARGEATFEAAGGPEAYFGAPAEASADEGLDIIERLGAILEDAVIEAISSDAVR